MSKFWTRETDNVILIDNVPFGLEKGEDGWIPLQSEVELEIDSKESYDYLLFTGMVTQYGVASEWWGPSEFWYDNSTRLFLGDLMGQLRIIYDSRAVECIPLLYGVTVWNYDIHCDLKPNENINQFGGPFKEPFVSDEQAKKLFDDCLLLNENPGGDKATHFVLAVKLKARPISKIRIFIYGGKRSVPLVYGYTFVRGQCPFPKVADGDFFLRKKYLNSVRALSHRLYQFREDIPENLDYVGRKGEAAEVRFEGGRTAKLLQNVYAANLNDMSENKIDADGKGHTSSPKAASFGAYIGDGLFLRDAGWYYSQCWSRDLGRTAIELIQAGNIEHIPQFIERIHGYLYDDKNTFYPATWKRVCNNREVGEGLDYLCKLKENDGHASMMLAVYHAYLCGAISGDYIRAHTDYFADAVGWYRWQVDHPEQSNFCGVLASESEASIQDCSLPDLFSNVISIYALLAYAELAKSSGLDKLEKESRTLAELLCSGIDKVFLADTEPFGKVYHDCTYDCWTYDYKRFAGLFLCSDLFGYELSALPQEIRERLENSYWEQKSRFFHPQSGRQMGYGQGYLTQTALMLDEVEDYTACMQACAEFCYHGYDENYIVPEGVICHPEGGFWFRNGDLGNAVQQAEIVKCVRLLLGIDTLSAELGLRLIPRLPEDFTGLQVKRYPLRLRVKEKLCESLCDYSYRREGHGYALSFSSDKPIKVCFCRFGPFPANADATSGCPEERAEIIAGRKYVIVPIGREITSFHMTVGER